MSKYKIAYRDANPSWQELCPVRMLAIQVSRDTETGACFLQTKIVNVSTKPISRIEFTVGLEGEGGETETVDFSLLDADLPAGEVLRPKAARIKLSVITGSRAVVTRADCVPSSKNRQIRLSNFDTLMLTASGRAGAVAAGPPAA